MERVCCVQGEGRADRSEAGSVARSLFGVEGDRPETQGQDHIAQ